MINWNIARGPSSFDNAFAMGSHLGAKAKQGRVDNALAAYALDPDSDEAFQGLAKAAPQYAIKVQGARAEKQKQQEFIDYRKRALQGDEEAQRWLEVQDNDAYNRATDEQRRVSDESDKQVANALFHIERLPLADRSAAWDAVAKDAGADELVGMYGPEAVRAISAKGGVAKALAELGDPKYMPIPEGGTLVNTRDPGAVSQFAAEGNAPPPPPGFVLDEGGPASAPGNFPG